MSVPCQRRPPLFPKLFQVKIGELNRVCNNALLVRYSHGLVMACGVLAVLWNGLETYRNLVQRTSRRTLHTLTGWERLRGDWAPLNFRLNELAAAVSGYAAFSALKIMYNLQVGNISAQMSYLQVSVMLRILKWSAEIVKKYRGRGPADGEPAEEEESTFNVECVQSAILMFVWLTLMCNTHRHFGTCAT